MKPARPLFLDNVYSWTRTQRRSAAPVEDSIAIERFKPSLIGRILRALFGVWI